MSCSVNLRALPTEVLEEVFTPENVQVRPITSPLSTLSFPKSRHALWDGAATGDETLLHLCAHRAPRVQLMEKALRLAQRHVRHSSRTLLHCFFIGSVSVDSDELGVTVTLDRFDPGRERDGIRIPSAALPMDVCAPCVFTSNPDHGALVQSEAELQRTFKTLYQSLSGRQSLDLSQILRLGLIVVWTRTLDSMDFALSWSCVSLANAVTTEPIRAIHVIPTALLRSLTSPARPTAVSTKRGFVTMDQTRKLLLLLESDPKALSLPLVGVWFSGAAQVHSPHVWTWTLRFLHSCHIQDRTLSESGYFLLLLFGSTQRAPQFFQCKASGAGPELRYGLLTGHHRTTLYQQVASVEGQTLKCDLSSETDSRETEVFTRVQRAFLSAPVVAAVAPAGLSVTDQDSGVEDEDLSPRPSPSPHQPPPQARRITPSVPELSLLIDGSFSNPDAPGPGAPPPPADRKCASPLRLHSTPHSNLQPQNCACCHSNSPHICTAIHPSPGQNRLHTYLQATPVSQSIDATEYLSPPGHRQSPSSRRMSLTGQKGQQTGIHRRKSLPHVTQQCPVLCHGPQVLTQNVPNLEQSPTNPAQNQNHFTLEQASNLCQNQVKIIQMQKNPTLNPFQTPQDVCKLHQITNIDLTTQIVTTPLSQSPVSSLSHQVLTQNVPNFQRSPTQMTQNPPLNPFQSPQNVGHLHQITASANNPCAPTANTDSAVQNSSLPVHVTDSMMAHGQGWCPALLPPPCVGRCCEQQGALSSGKAFQLLLQQDRQLRLLQQQVQMLLEAQGKLQPQSSESQTKATASVAVGTGASLFWPEPPTCQDSPPSPSASPAGGTISPPRFCPASPPSKPPSCDRSEVRAERSPPSMEARSPAAFQGGVSVESPVLGESVSMYRHEENHQESFYHSLMTQLNSRLREDQETEQEEEEPKQEETESKPQDEEFQGRSLDCGSVLPPPAPLPCQASAPASKTKKRSITEDIVVSATLRRLRQLGVTLDKLEPSEKDRAQSTALESTSTLARIDPVAAVSCLRLPDPALSLLPHSSADLSLEANAIALRYLSDQQLTRLSLPERHAPSRADTSAASAVLSPDMSLATRRYMRKYGLIEEEEEEEELKERPFCVKLLPQSQLIRELKPKMKLLARNGGSEEDKENMARGREMAENQGSIGNILDLSRLRQLPKLF